MPWLPQASYPCGNFSDTSSLKLLKTKGSIGHAFTVCIHTENQNQVSFYPFVPREISVLTELTLGHYSIVKHRKCITKHMINPRISAVWSTTKQIASFSCTPRVQEVHTKAEVVHLTTGLLGLGVLFNCHA